VILLAACLASQASLLLLFCSDEEVVGTLAAVEGERLEEDSRRAVLLKRRWAMAGVVVVVVFVVVVATRRTVAVEERKRAVMAGTSRVGRTREAGRGNEGVRVQTVLAGCVRVLKGSWLVAAQRGGLSLLCSPSNSATGQSVSLSVSVSPAEEARLNKTGHSTQHRQRQDLHSEPELSSHARCPPCTHHTLATRSLVLCPFLPLPLLFIRGSHYIIG